MKKDALLAMGLTEEQVTKVLGLHKTTIEGEYIPKHRFDEVNGELKLSKEALGERDKQIGDLKKFEGDTKALTDQIKVLQEDNATKDKEYKATLATERKANAVKLALINDEDGKPHDANMVLGLFNLDQITLDEATGKVAGMTEQLGALRKEKSFLFAPKAEPAKPGFTPAGIVPALGDPNGAKGLDPSVAFGKSLAQQKLGMLGIKPATPGTETGK